MSRYNRSDSDLKRIKEISKVVNVPLVLHGGSGVRNIDFTKSINAGVTIVHISTILRLAWRNGIEKSLKEGGDELAPYKLLRESVNMVRNETEKKIKLFRS